MKDLSILMTEDIIGKVNQSTAPAASNPIMLAAASTPKSYKASDSYNNFKNPINTKRENLLNLLKKQREEKEKIGFFSFGNK